MAATQQPRKRAKRRSGARSTQDTPVLVARLALRAAYVALAAAAVTGVCNVVVAALHH
jgi:hypothetical protein